MEIWKTKEGELVPIKTMGDRHLLNCIRFIQRKVKRDFRIEELDLVEAMHLVASGQRLDECDLLHKDYVRIFLENDDAYTSLVAEAKRRDLPVPRAILFGEEEDSC